MIMLPDESTKQQKYFIGKIERKDKFILYVGRKKETIFQVALYAA